jgi:hypothetical protein
MSMNVTANGRSSLRAWRGGAEQLRLEPAKNPGRALIGLRREELPEVFDRFPVVGNNQDP